MKLINVFLVIGFIIITSTTKIVNAQQPVPANKRLDGKQESVTTFIAPVQKKQMMIRIAEIEIHAQNLEEYKAILREGAEASLRLEPGVISIFPMYQTVNPAQVRILEIYESREAYEAHLKTPHFQKYKTTTLHMVKSLQLTEMEAIDEATMTKIFGKLQ
jgi:quinol monooxygenase YgiN